MKFHLLKLVVILFTLLGSPVTFAQAPAAGQTTTPAQKPAVRRPATRISYQALLEGKKSHVEQQLEERARKVIASQLDAGQYLLYVKVQMDDRKIGREIAKIRAQKKLRLRSLPANVQQQDEAEIRFLSEMTDETIFLYIGKKIVSFTVDSGLTADQVNSLRGALVNAIGITAADEFKVSQTKMATSSMQNRLEQAGQEAAQAREQARRTEMLLRELEIKKQEAGTQAAQLDTKVNRLQDELMREREKADELKKQLDEFGSDKTALGKLRRLVKGFELPLTLLPIALIIAAIAVWAIRSSQKSTQNIAAGLQGLAAAAQRIAQTQQQTAQLGNNDNSQQVKALAEGNAALPESAEGLELSHKEAMHTWELLKKNESLLLSVLKDWLSDSEGRIRFIYFSEAIGAEDTRALWEKFPKAELELLEPLLFTKVPKSAAYSTVLQLHRAVGKEVAGKPPFFTKLDLSFLSSLQDFELAEVMDNSSIEAAAAALLFVTPKRATKLLALQKTHMKENLIQTMRSLTEMTEAVGAQYAAELKQYKPQTSKAVGFDLAEHMVVLLESSNAQQDTKQAVARLLETDKTLSIKVRSRVLTFAEVLMLDDETISDLVSPLSPEQVAQLVFPMEEKQAEKILSFFSQKVVFAIRQEAGRINQKASSRRAARGESNRIQQAIVRRVKVLIEQGQIELNTNSSTDKEEAS